MLLFTRNNPISHPMLRQLIGANSDCQIKKIYNIFYEAKVSDKKIVVFDDPIAAVIGLVYYAFQGYQKKYWILEIYEHQLILNSISRFARYLVFKFAGILAIFMCNEIFVSSKLRRKYVLDKYKRIISRKEVRIILNVPEKVIPVPLNNELSTKLIKFSADKKLLAVYAGSIQYGRDVGLIVESFSKQSEYGLILCGRIKDELSRSKILDNESVLYLGELNYGEVLKVYESCRVGLLSYANEPLNVKFSAPVKMWEYLRSNLLLVGNHNFALQTEWSNYISAYYGEDVGVCEAIKFALTNNKKIKGNVNIDFNNPFEGL